MVALLVLLLFVGNVAFMCWFSCFNVLI